MFRSYAHHPLAFLLPDDHILRRVHAHSAMTAGGYVDIYLVEISSSEPCWNSDESYVQPITRGSTLKVRVGIGALPALSLNELFRGPVRKANKSVLPKQGFRLDIFSGRVQSLRSVGLSREQYWRGSPSAFDDSNVAVYSATDCLGRLVQVIIPCFEVLRMFYLPNTRFAHALLREPSFDEGVGRLLNLEKSSVEGQEVTLCLREDMPDDTISVQCAALLAKDPVSSEFARKVSISNRTGDYFNALIPTSRSSLSVVGETFALRGAETPTYFLLRLVKTENPLPVNFERLAYSRESCGSPGESATDERRWSLRPVSPTRTLSLADWLGVQKNDVGGVSDTSVWCGQPDAWDDGVMTSRMRPRLSRRKRYDGRTG